MQIDPSVPLFGYIGRLEEQKGVDILMAALPKALAGVWRAPQQLRWCSDCGELKRAALPPPEALHEAAHPQPALQRRQTVGCTLKCDCCSAESSCAALQAVRRCRWPSWEQVRGLHTLTVAR